MPAIEGLFEGMEQTAMVGEGAMQGVDQMPPVELVGGAPAVVSGEGLDPIGAIPYQEEMLGVAKAEVALSCQEEPFAEVLGGFDAGVGHAFQQTVAAVGLSNALPVVSAPRRSSNCGPSSR